MELDDKNNRKSTFAVCGVILASSVHSILIALSKDAEHNLTYSPISVVLLSECLKFFASIVLLFVYNSTSSIKELKFSLEESKKYFIPAAIYAVDNNLFFIIMQFFLEPATVLVLGNAKIITTAIFFRLILKRQLSKNQWISLWLLCSGLIICESNCDSKLVIFNVGFALIMFTSALAGLADVYAEYAYKKNAEQSIHYQNIQLYFFGIVFNSLGFLLFNFTKQFEFFKGWNLLTVIIMILSAFNGMSIGAVFKYADVMIRIFAGAAAMILTTILSIFLFDFFPSVVFVCGVFVVFSAIYFYHDQKIQI